MTRRLLTLVRRPRPPAGDRPARHGRPASREAGAGLVEYALLIAIVSIAMSLSTGFLGDGVGDSLDDSADDMAEAADGDYSPPPDPAPPVDTTVATTVAAADVDD